jgi:periplasmic glucans biosynthesis protein
MSFRLVLASLLLLLALAPGTIMADLFEQITEQARERAAHDYVPPATELAQPLAAMNYEQYRSIRFRPEAALWRDQALFEVQLFHPGFLYQKSVRIHVVHNGRVEPLPFDQEAFRYEGAAAELTEAVTPELGYAGFRVHFPLNSAVYKDEVVVFLGASYFRLLGRNQVYGLSARGLAIDTALTRGEEFPEFREFWLIQPAPEDTTLTLYALLDSPSLTGAYRFELRPGANTVLDVESRLFARLDIAKLGAAPLTSMFLFGENRLRAFDDFRPRVHDSDGLLMHTSAGEWIWRPLSNGHELRVTSLMDGTPRGFGLLQRERAFDRYLDLEARYDRRPSHWVEVGDGDWGAGGVELVEIPSDSEINDNIVAYWVPGQPFRAGEQRRFRYRLISFNERLHHQTLAQVDRTRIGWGAIPGEENPPPRSRRQFIVDFSGGELTTLDASQPVEAKLSTSSGQVSDLLAQRLPDGGWRAAFRLAPNDAEPADMRLFLELRGHRLSETWSYVWYPADVQ